jgi:hypothetical protein
MSPLNGGALIAAFYSLIRPRWRATNTASVLVAADLGGRLLQPGVKRRNALWAGEVHVRDGNPDLRDGVCKALDAAFGISVSVRRSARMGRIP